MKHLICVLSLLLLASCTTSPKQAEGLVQRKIASPSVTNSPVVNHVCSIIFRDLVTADRGYSIEGHEIEFVRKAVAAAEKAHAELNPFERIDSQGWALRSEYKNMFSKITKKSFRGALVLVCDGLSTQTRSCYEYYFKVSTPEGGEPNLVGILEEGRTIEANQVKARFVCEGTYDIKEDSRL